VQNIATNVPYNGQNDDQPSQNRTILGWVGLGDRLKNLPETCVPEPTGNSYDIISAIENWCRPKLSIADNNRKS
jgi:predicted ABC-type transport system involved in lysophospholipase L1 biosynthesis ATPase subunit